MVADSSAAQVPTLRVKAVIVQTSQVAQVSTFKVLVEIQATPLPHNFPFF
jgi:hypothetical protein